MRHGFRAFTHGTKRLEPDLRGVRSPRAMLYWAFVFLVIAVIAGALGFRGLSAAAATVAKVLFGIFLLLFLLFLLLGLGIVSAVN